MCVTSSSLYRDYSQCKLRVRNLCPSVAASLIASLNALISRDSQPLANLSGVKCIRLLISGYHTKRVGIDMSYLFCFVHSTIVKVDFLRASTWRRRLVELRLKSVETPIIRQLNNLWDSFNTENIERNSFFCIKDVI